MKQVSLILNIILIVLVAILFYWHFNNKHFNANSPASSNNATTAKSMRIAYVNLDTLQQYYTYFKQRRAQLENKQQAMENELNADAQALQKKANDFQQKASTMTQAEGEAAQKALVQQQQALQEKQQNMRQELMQAQQQFQNDLQNQLDSFLLKYNADKRYTYILSYASDASDILYKDTANDITRDVLNGLNAASTKK